MLIVENYYNQHTYLKDYDPYNVAIEADYVISNYSIYDIERVDLFSLALVHGFRIEQLLASEQFVDIVKLMISRQVTKYVNTNSMITKLYTTVA